MLQFAKALKTGFEVSQATQQKIAHFSYPLIISSSRGLRFWNDTSTMSK
jgi:hypothetical protein